MTDEDLRQYGGQQVKLELMPGVVLAGELIVEGAACIALGVPYAIKSLHRSPAVDVLEPAYTGIPDAAAVEWGRILEQQPDDEQLFD